MCQLDLLLFGGFTVLTQLLLTAEQQLLHAFLKVTCSIFKLSFWFSNALYFLQPLWPLHQLPNPCFHPFCTSTFITLFCGSNIHQVLSDEEFITCRISCVCKLQMLTMVQVNWKTSDVRDWVDDNWRVCWVRQRPWQSNGQQIHPLIFLPWWNARPYSSEEFYREYLVI